MTPNELRTVVYDAQLHLEAYRFAGIVQPFPNHFHAHYVLGLVEHGQRTLCCKNREHHLCPGDLLLFNPGESHGCTQTDGLPAGSGSGLCLYPAALCRTSHVGTSLPLCGPEQIDPAACLCAGKRCYLTAIWKPSASKRRSNSFFGIALCGPKKKVNKLTGSLPLLR